MKNLFSFAAGAVAARSVWSWVAGCWLALLPLLGWATGPATTPAAAPATALALALTPDGTLRPGAAGSFDTKGFEMFTAPDGRPVFRPAGARRTQGAGDEGWQNGFGLPGTNGTLFATAVAANGDVYVGGQFTAAGTVPASNVARWDGTAWNALGTGVNNAVRSLAVSGTDLYVGGSFTTAGGAAASRIAKWDGAAWSPLGTGLDGPAFALAVLGTDLYVGGSFTTAGGVAASNMARWDGAAWSALGAGTDAPVNVLAVQGTDVYVGGSFTTAGGGGASNVARWDGAVWHPLGTGVNAAVNALAVAGSTLYVGGAFVTAGGAGASRVARWNGTAWSTLSVGVNNTVSALAVSGSNVYVGGSFTTAGGATATRMARWNGSAWSALGNGINNTVNTLAVDGSNLYAGGIFQTAGTAGVSNVARWDGTAWNAMGDGLNNIVIALAVAGTDLYVGGAFTRAGPIAANYIAKWDGSTWSALGTGFNSQVNTLAVAGTDLYAGGAFTTAGGVAAPYVAKWNGTAWSALGSGVGGSVYALAVAGTDLYVGGSFTMAGGAAASRVAKWDGAAWSPLGTGVDATVWGMAMLGTDLCVGGDFGMAGGASASRVAKWNGTAWSPLGAGMNGTIWVLAASGSTLYAGGQFTVAGAVSATNIARWNGTAWSALGSGLTNSVYGLALLGTDLYAGGPFVSSGSTSLRFIAKWNGSAWSALGTGLNSSSSVLAAGPGNRLNVGGPFTTVNDGSKVMGRLGIFTPVVPVLSSLSPVAELPGQAVQLTGTGFLNGSTVSFGGVAAGSVTYNSPTSLTATVPLGVGAGTRAVVVSTTSNNSAGSPAFEVLQVYRNTAVTGCLPTASASITGSGGAGVWRYLRLPGAGGAVVAAIEDTRNLGTVTAGFTALGTSTASAVRTDGLAGRRYLDRNFYLTATNATFPGQTVRVRFFGLNSEQARLQAVDPNATLAGLKASQYDGPNENCALADNDPAGTRRLLPAPATVLSGADWFTAQVDVPDHFSEFYLTGASTPLPVELVSFTATAQNGAVQLAWRTASEKNSARFEVESSADGRTFERIGTVAAQGTTTRPTDYAYLDHQVPKTIRPQAPTYYRLRQVDQDGTASYSPVRAVAVGGQSELTFYPNPARTAVAVGGLPAGAAVQVLDALGRTVAAATADAAGTAQLALPTGLATGMYVVRSGGYSQRLTVE